jgi:hypothetical protein
MVVGGVVVRRAWRVSSGVRRASRLCTHACASSFLLHHPRTTASPTAWLTEFHMHLMKAAVAPVPPPSPPPLEHGGGRWRESHWHSHSCWDPHCHLCPPSDTNYRLPAMCLTPLDSPGQPRPLCTAVLSQCWPIHVPVWPSPNPPLRAFTRPDAPREQFGAVPATLRAVLSAAAGWPMAVAPVEARAAAALPCGSL